MSDARARIHAMFPLDEAATTELDARLDAHRAEVLAEGAEAIDVKQDEYEAEERKRFGHLDHETVRQREAVRDMAALLRQMADEGKAATPAAPARDFFQPGHVYRVADGIHRPNPWIFDVRHIDAESSGRLVAFGLLSKGAGAGVGHVEYAESWSRGWTDITPAGGA